MVSDTGSKGRQNDRQQVRRIATYERDPSGDLVRRIKLDRKNGGTSVGAFSHKDIDYIYLRYINSENAELAIGGEGRQIMLEDSCAVFFYYCNKANSLLLRMRRKLC